ncbi:hypothetical protein D3C87_1929490 [compost metagenome]
MTAARAMTPISIMRIWSCVAELAATAASAPVRFSARISLIASSTLPSVSRISTLKTLCAFMFSRLLESLTMPSATER